MNFFDILSEIEKVDPEVYDRLDSRRRVFKHMSGVGQKLAAAAVPMFVGAVFNKAYAQTPANLGVLDVLNFALKLEYLEMYFYQDRTSLTVGTASGNISQNNLTALARIATDESNHVNFLRTAISGASGTPVSIARTEFDFTGARVSSSNSVAGPFANYRTNADTYLALAESFEDTGIRAYKGAAPLTAVMANKTVLTAALNIHSVEARHASYIRAMRRAGSTSATPSQGVAVSPYSAQPKSWISGTDNGGASSMYTSPIYGAGNDTGAATYGSSAKTGTNANVTFPAESNTTQGGAALSASTLTATAGFPAASYSEAFDEGLDVGTVSAIAKGFTVATSTIFG